MPKSLIALRRQEGAVCPICQSPDYTITPNELIGGKPNIKCGSCGRGWQYGYSGGVYADYAGERSDTSSYYLISTEPGQ